MEISNKYKIPFFICLFFFTAELGFIGGASFFIHIYKKRTTPIPKVKIMPPAKKTHNPDPVPIIC